MGTWVHLVTFIGVAFIISCEAKSPKRPVIDDSTGENDDNDSDNYPTCGANEVYDICPRLCPPRRCDVDERIIRCAENPKPGDPKCEPGCRCADNYYRNNDGDCVTKDECPKCFQKNEVYACRRSDPQTCETIDEEYEPIKNNKKHCKRECRCKDGYYRNKIGECISKKNCLKCSGPHEYFTCGSACDNVCDTIHSQNQTNCPVKNIKCNPKCYCEYGYARDDNNICVPIAECPPKCNGQNEVYECKSSCPQTCDTIGEKCISKHISKRHCKRECRCKKGYYRNKLGVCISKKNCLKCSGPNEFFSCGGACDNVCSTMHLQNQTSCPIVNIVCNKMCYCEEGYARDENNICVPIEDCPPICGINEVYDICPRLCPPRRCDVDERLIRCARNPEPGDPRCKPGCRCADNYYRNNDGVCVTKKECPKCTRKNEVYTCRSSDPQTCETIGEDYGPIKQTKHCKRECRCKKGYYRNKIGDCISKKNCLKCSGPNEFYSCGGACDNVCSTMHLQNQTSCPIVNIVCNKMCYCEEGYARDENNICIPIEDCPPICGVNEVYDICPRLCPPRTCGADKRRYKCPKSPKPGDPRCKPGCRCADNYYRNKDGVCVTKKECKKCTRKNEVYECPTSRPQTCETIDEDYEPIKKTKHCKPVCQCKKGYYKNKIGECISKKDCLKCNGPHEYFSCGPACDNVCETLQSQNQTNCPIKNRTCNKKCYCEEGYARDKNNICVPIGKCPPKCGLNEVYDICPRLCPPRICGADKQKYFCPRSPNPGDPSCKPGCRCADNYYRNNDGVCVTKKECPICTRKNEVYACPTSRPQTCETIDEDYEPIKKTKHCKPICQCKEGYYKNKIGECISKKDCLKCNGPHEYFTCGPACDNVCETLQSQNQTNCPIKNKTCNKKCYCEEGYARDKNNICVPIEKCQPVCGINEVYDICPPVCPPQRCDVNIAAISCIPSPKPGDPDCNPGCRCADDHVRNDVGICIPRDECPPEPTCGVNEEPSDCANGGCRRRECSDEGIICYDLTEGSCIKGCVCKDSYVRDNNGVCIPEDQCPQPLQCGLNEEYSTCANGGCRRFTCAMGGILCVDLVEGGCNAGCICKPSYTRADNGTCIPEDQCPPTCPVNEVYDTCPALCPPRSCDVDDRTIDCAPNPLPGDPECNPGCRCADNYYRNDLGVCVTREECPLLIECGKNEIASRCANNNGGCRKLSCAVPEIVCAKIPPALCQEGCICAENYLRADNGTCILESECPPVCGLHEVYDECPATCPPQRCDVDNRLIKCKRTPTPGDPECKPGCRCEDNYYRNSVGECVTREECPPLIKCGSNEIASKCANGGCRKRSCAKPQVICAKLPAGACKEGCICKENYLRGSNGTCIPESECPPVCGLHEVYDECPPTCPPQRCDVDNRLIKCKRTPTPGDPECKPGCRCEDDFYRNDNGVCVTREECPPLIQCGENEYASSCANGGCRKVSCARPQIRCVKLKEGACEEGCLCNDNYLRAENGTCIPEEECPPVCGINEIYDICPPLCPPPRCDVDASLILCKPNPKPGDPECNPGCRCADNFFKNNEGVCVPRDECPPPIECGLNEEYSTCANGGCRRYSCNMTAILCIDLREGACRPGCICKDTYTRSDDGICIPEKECPKICGPNEEYGCDNTCSKTCNTVDGKCAPPVKSKICKLQCHCKDGYKRNKKGECVKECDGVTEKTTDGLTAFEQGNIDFTEQFLITASKKNPGESVIGSPFSVLFLLAQLALYATGQAKTQLLNLLNLSTDCEIRTTVPKYFKLIAETNNASFDLAQKIYGSDKYPFSKKFKKDSREVFNAEAQNVDFAKPKEAAAIINKWVAQQTHNLINNLVSPDSLSADTRLVLAIAIYFKGDWQRQFKARNTKSLPFYSPNGEVQVKMMNQVGSFKYAEIDGVQVLQMPYTVRDISFVACLPKSKTGVKKLVNKLKKSSFIKRTLSELKSTTVDVSIPTLDISTTTDLKQVLVDSGVDAIFDPSTAGLSGILKTPEDIFVTSAIQKAKLLLNETGTQAAAATAITGSATGVAVPVIPPIKFNADHPFIYYILCNKLPVFAGIYTAITVGITSVAVQEVLPIKFNADHPFIYYIVYKKLLVFAGVYLGPQ